MQRQRFLQACAAWLAGGAWSEHSAASAGGAARAQAAGAAGQGAAAAWPAGRAVKLVVNFPAGGSPDVVARALAAPLAAALGVPVRVENRGGAGGIVGTEAVAKAAPDGHTLLLSSGSAMSILPLVRPRLPYHPQRDLVPVAGAARMRLFLVARAGLPFNDYAGFLRHARAHPGRLSYGSPGNGTSPHLAGEMLKAQAGFFSVHVPYQGSGAVLQDLLGGRIDHAFDTGIAFPYIDDGRLRLLAVGSGQRAARYPATPTLQELGLPGFDTGTTHGLWAPAGTPPAVLARLAAEVKQALQGPAVAAAIHALGAEVTPLGAAPFAEVTARDRERYAAIVKLRGIVADE